MGWIICRASVRVVGLSVRAGHSSGVVPFPGVEDDSLASCAPVSLWAGVLQGGNLPWGRLKADRSFTDFPIFGKSAWSLALRSDVLLALCLCLTARLKRECLWIGMRRRGSSF